MNFIAGEDRLSERRLIEAVGAGEPLPVDDQLDERSSTLVQEAEESGEASEMTAQDWAGIRQEGNAILQSRQGR